MYTQCPHCYSIYRVGPGELGAAGGRVQCAACEIIFNALPQLREELPELDPGQESLDLPLEERRDSPRPFDREPEDWQPVPGSAFAMPAAGRGSPSHLARGLWSVGSAALLLAMLVQLAVLAPRAMAQDPAFRPFARLLCGLSGCEVPPRQNLSRLRLASRDVRAHPSVPGALIISATLVNEADFAQPFPKLEIALSDLQGDAVALRRFRPADYLPESVDIDAGMAASSVVQVSLEVVDPGQEAVAFEFAFRPAADARR